MSSSFGPYELRSLIGVGGMGEVYQAYDTTKDRMVALKLLRREKAGDPSYRERFRRECRMVARLQDPHVIPVHDFGEIDGVLFIDMRLVNGGSLRDLLSERGALDPVQAASIIAQVAAALDTAHADGLVHRDVKPENVLLTGDGFAYLVDFGIAYAGPVEPGGPIIGSGAYMAPERFSGGGVGPGTDVYSLACVLYECLTGVAPFEGLELRDLIGAHMSTPPPRPSIMRRGIARAFDDVIAIGMAKQPEARFIFASDLAKAASAAAASLASSASLAASASLASDTRPFATHDIGAYPASPPPAVATRTSRAPVVVGGLAVVMLVVAAVMAAILASGGGSPPNGTPLAAPPAASSAPPTTSPSLSGTVQGADGQGFVGHTARCDAGNPPAAVVRTAKSLAVVCQSASRGFYYRGERISDGANIELADAVRDSGGFDIVNPANGVRYEVRPERLRILSGRHVDSSERVLQYASAG